MIRSKKVLGFKAVFIAVVLILGLYLLNVSFVWIKMPEFIILNEKYITGFSGALLIVFGVMAAFRRPRNY